jgi:hypothetical protein
MATNAQQTPPEVSTTSLVSGIINDAQELFKAQLELFKAELKQDLQRTKEGATMATVGGGVGFVGVIVLALGLVHLLWTYVPAVPLWGWYLIVGGVFCAVGGSLVYVVLNRVEKAKPLSETTAGIEENVEWKTNQK